MSLGAILESQCPISHPSRPCVRDFRSADSIFAPKELGVRIGRSVGDPVAGLTAVGFHVFTTGENTQPPQRALNMPGITFEVDPNLTLNATNFSSVVFQPTANSPAGQWSSYIDATLDSSGTWYLTGTAGTTTPGRGRRLPRQQRDLRFRGVRRAGRRPVENRARGGCERPPRAGLLSVPTPRYLGHGAVFGDRAGVGRGRGGRCRGRGS